MNESYEKAIEEYQEIEGDEEVMRRISPLMAECYMKLEQYEKAYQLLSTIINDPDMEDGPTNYINYIRCCTELSATTRLPSCYSRRRNCIRTMSVSFLF